MTLVDGRAGLRSKTLFDRATKVMPGGVNSPVRAFGSVGSEPPFIRSAHGAHLVTEDGVTVIDYVGSWGPALLGHAHPEVVEAVTRVARDGLGFGAATEAEIDLAEQVCRLVPGLCGGMVRLVTSGTEATMSALRLARGVTARDKIVKIDGGYHGHADMLLAAAGSGAATLGIPGSAGVPETVVKDTIVVPFNDVTAMENVFLQHGLGIAALIVEPVPGNMGCVPPRPGYLAALRDITARNGSLLIFDEVMTGFRVALGGAQELYGVTPDLTCLGKVVGGGLPLAAYGGRRDIMERVAPLGPVYQAGTLSGNPLAVAAGRATLTVLERDRPYEHLEHATERLVRGLAGRAHHHGVGLHTTRVGSMFTGFFQGGEVVDYVTAKRSDSRLFAAWHGEMLARGVYLAPSQYEAGFVSTAHDDIVLEVTLEAADGAFAVIADGRIA